MPDCVACTRVAFRGADAPRGHGPSGRNGVRSMRKHSFPVFLSPTLPRHFILHLIYLWSTLLVSALGVPRREILEDPLS